MSKELDQKAIRTNLPSQEYYESYERIFGWRCGDCRINNKEANCSQCFKPKDEAIK